MLIVVISKALYGCVKSGVLWYNLYSGVLKGLGFVLNPVEPCMANAMIEGKQCTIGWYVDDNKISYFYSRVVNYIIEKIEERFGKMKVSRGKKHVFLGMDIKFVGNKRVWICICLLYTSPSPRDATLSRMPSSA